jgi:internalin A
VLNSIALDLIYANRRSRNPFIDLGNCAISEIPLELFENTWLVEISFSSYWWDINDNDRTRTRCSSLNGEDHNRISKIPPQVKCLINLRKLWIGGDVECRMPITSIGPLANLSNLKILGLGCTNINSIEPLRSLCSLVYIDMWNCENIQSLSPVSELRYLQYLDVWGTRVKNLSPLSGLTQLKFLNICETPVSNLLPVLGMVDREIDVLEDYPEEENSEGIYVYNCPLRRPPPEIISGGSASIKIFFDESRAQGVDHLFEAKMLIVGEGGAGKTSLLRRLYKQKEPLPEESETTKGISIHKHQFTLSNGRKYRLNVWDFGGQEIYHATHQFFLTKRSLYILVDDTRRDSKTVHDEGFKYWLEVIDALSGHSPVLLFQNEKGGRSKAIDQPGISSTFTNVKEFFRGDLSKKGTVGDLRKAVEFYVQNLPHVGEELPAKWLLIRADIEKESKDYPFISQARYFDIYARHLRFDRVRALHLSRYLHDLGVFLHFQEDVLLSRTIILQNQWATEAVFMMMEDAEVKRKFGRFVADDYRKTWSDIAYCDMHPELLALMQKFELCYQLPDTTPHIWIIPQLLPPSRPERLRLWEKPDDIVLRYRYEFMPKGLINRLMVRQHRFVRQPDLGWVSGALFERSDTEVLAVVAPTGNEIILRARGAEQRELLSVISSDLDALNSTFHGVSERVRRFIQCRCARCAKSPSPEYFDLAKLLQRRRDNKSTIECGESYLNVRVTDLLEGTFSSAPRSWEEGTTDVRGIPSTQTMPNVCRVFLASSLNLKAQRDQIDLYLRKQNDRLREQGRYLEIVRCEDASLQLSSKGDQETLNDTAAACGVFLCFISSDIGESTVAEFDSAYESFRRRGLPRIYVFKLNSDEMIASSKRIENLSQFIGKIENLGHYIYNFNSIDVIRNRLRDELDAWFE